MMTQDSGARRTLLVDDDASLLDALQRSFTEAGEHIVACSSFAEARRALQTTHFDALITDVRLGEFNGLQLAVIGREAYPDIRLIVFSGFDDPVLRTEADHVGATYVVKPVTSMALLDLVRQPHKV